MGGSTRKMFLELSVLRASGSVACPRRPCERQPWFFCPVRKRQWRKPLPGPQRTWDSLAAPEGSRAHCAFRSDSQRPGGSI